jgi:ubiquinone/menaquinone biosynthesis C-methylase UbiE
MNDSHKSQVQTQFGVAADDYAQSEVHARGESLELLVRLIRPQENWRMLDVATGAGHTAMAFALYVKSVIASDLTESMLAKTAELCQAAGLANVATEYAAAEGLPFADESFEAVTCRLAMHHFSDVEKSLSEIFRVLKPGGKLGLSDNVTVENIAAAEYYNRYERLRDPSHERVYSTSELRSWLQNAGLEVLEQHQLSKEFEFNDWADRQRVSAKNKERLLGMMRRIPQALNPLFQPRWENDTLYFSLWEVVMVAKRKGSLSDLGAS